MGKYATYPESADSKVEWLGRIPTDWQALPIAALLEERGELNKGLRTENVLSVLRDIGVIPYEEKGDIGNKKSEDIERYKVVYPGDLVVNSMNVIIGSVGVSAYHGALSPVYLVLKPRHGKAIHKHYVGYTFQIKTFQQWLKRLGYGILEHRLRIPMDNLKREYLPVPPYADQERIVDFLDHETTKIDRLIAKQERLIELLKEKRQAVISHAVTKGLNPDASMKDSGVEWLGEVPAHWDVMATKFVCSLIKDGTHLPPPRVADGVRLLSVRNIVGGRFVLRDDDSMISEESYAELARSLVVKVGDVLLAIVGATLGKVAIVEELDTRFHLQRSLGVFRVRETLIRNEYLRYAFVSDGFQQLLWENVGFSAQPGIYLGALADFRIPVPSLGEQQAIIDYINEKAGILERLQEKAEVSIRLMREHRTALISAAVTGKIDVRNFKPANA